MPQDSLPAASAAAAARAARISTPAVFAQAASGEKWHLASHLSHIDRAITAMIRDPGDRLLIVEAPPRHGKSELISRYLPAWFLGRFPARRVMLASHQAALAESWSRKSREVLRQTASWFGLPGLTGKRAAAEWETAGGGGMIAAGVGGALTGRGADLLIVDDYLKNSEQAVSRRMRDKQWDWWQSTAATRLEPLAVAIVMATRWHEDDLIGRLLAAAHPPASRIRLPALAEEGDPLCRLPGEALWPERYDAATLRNMRRGMDAYWWLAMYQQRPARHGRSEWPDAYFGDHLWATHWPDAFEASAVAVDPSKGRGDKGGDYFAVVFVGHTAGVLWADALLARSGGVEEIVARALDFLEQHRPHVVGIEGNVFQELLAPEFDRQRAERRLSPLPISLLENRQSKRHIRIPRLGPHLARRQIRIRDTPSGRLLVEQLREFPLADHDDGPDALEMAIRLLHQSAGRRDEPEEWITT